MCRLKNPQELKKIAQVKQDYGMKQVQTEFSTKNNNIVDYRAIEGKRILEQKILRVR